DERFGTVIVENPVDDMVVLGGILRPVHMDSVRLRICLELFQVFVEMDERVLLDGRGERAQLFPFRNAVHLAIALLPQVPEALVVHLLVFGRSDESGSRLRLVNRPIAMDMSAPRLRLGSRAQRLRGTLSVIETVAVAVNRITIVVSQKLGMQDA